MQGTFKAADLTSALMPELLMAASASVWRSTEGAPKEDDSLSDVSSASGALPPCAPLCCGKHSDEPVIHGFRLVASVRPQNEIYKRRRMRHLIG